jgi:hypothetical protein
MAIFLVMGNTNNLLHAQHNEKTCKYLRIKPDYLDWVITTAFYSAIHYVRFKMLPQTIIASKGSIEVTDFETFFSLCKKSHQGRHGFQTDQVVKLFPEIASEYSQLQDMCETARYRNYKADREMSNLAFERLQTIKKFCSS